MAQKHKSLKISLSHEELLASQRHTDWQIAHEAGRTRNGRSYLGHVVQGASKTKKAQNRRACRGKVSY